MIALIAKHFRHRWHENDKLLHFSHGHLEAAVDGLLVQRDPDCAESVHAYSGFM